MGKARAFFYRFVWRLNDRSRTILCVCGAAGFSSLLFPHVSWEVWFLLSWIFGVGSYLILLGVVIVGADGQSTQKRVSSYEASALGLLGVIILVTLLSNLGVTALLTAVGNRRIHDAQMLLGLSVASVIVSWIFLHIAFTKQYAILYYDTADARGNPFPGGLRRGLDFPGTDQPSYMDFCYVAFTIALTYATSDVNVSREEMRRFILIHSIVSFVFYSTVVTIVLNAIVTS